MRHKQLSPVVRQALQEKLLNHLRAAQVMVKLRLDTPEVGVFREFAHDVMGIQNWTDFQALYDEIQEEGLTSRKARVDRVERLAELSHLEAWIGAQKVTEKQIGHYRWHNKPIHQLTDVQVINWLLRFSDHPNRVYWGKDVSPEVERHLSDIVLRVVIGQKDLPEVGLSEFWGKVERRLTARGQHEIVNRFKTEKLMLNHQFRQEPGVDKVEKLVRVMMCQLHADEEMQQHVSAAVYWVCASEMDDLNFNQCTQTLDRFAEVKTVMGIRLGSQVPGMRCFPGLVGLGLHTLKLPAKGNYPELALSRLRMAHPDPDEIEDESIRLRVCQDNLFQLLEVIAHQYPMHCFQGMGGMRHVPILIQSLMVPLPLNPFGALQSEKILDEAILTLEAGIRQSGCFSVKSPEGDIKVKPVFLRATRPISHRAPFAKVERSDMDLILETAKSALSEHRYNPERIRQNQWLPILISAYEKEKTILQEQEGMSQLGGVGGLWKLWKVLKESEKTQRHTLLVASMEQLLIMLSGGVATGYCRNGIDRKSIEMMHTDALLIYLNELGRMPDLDNAADRQRFASYFAAQFHSLYHQMICEKQSPGRLGLANWERFVPHYLSQAVYHYPMKAQTVPVAQMEDLAAFSDLGDVTLQQDLADEWFFWLSALAPFSLSVSCARLYQDACIPESNSAIYQIPKLRWPRFKTSSKPEA